MANLTDGTNLTGTITLTKASGTKVTLDTDKRYLTKDIELTINAATASPTFTAAPTGSSTATGTNCTINSTNNSGVSIQTKYSINAVDIKYNAAANGWINKSANADTGSDTTAKTATNGTLYYINGVTLTTPTSGTRTFSITVPNGSSTITFVFNVDTSGNVTITEG